jgi:hypothetical protein
MRLTVNPLARCGQAKHLGYIAMLFCLLSVLAACGRKAMPIAPGTAPPPKVTDLSAAVSDGSIVLSWSLAARSVATNPQIEGFHLYREMVAKSDTACEKCPRKFERIAEVLLNLATDRPDGRRQWQYKVPADTGYHYAFKVNILFPDQLGPDSNIVEVDP